MREDKKGWTRARCQGCGKSQGRRRADEVCGECKELMRRGRLLAEYMAERLRDNQLYRYYVPSYAPAPGVVSWYALKETQEAMDALIDAVSEFGASPIDSMWRTPEVREALGLIDPSRVPDSSRDAYPNLLPHTGEPNYSSQKRAALKPEVAEQIAAFDEAMRRGMQIVWDQGVQYGQSLLVRLAEGTITEAEYEAGRLGKERR